MSPRDEDSRRAQEDAEWQALVESYGDRPEFPEPAEGDLEPAFADDFPEVLPLADGQRELEFDDEERYVPPPPPPLPRPRGIRLVAWFGLFGVPALVLLCIMVKISLPSFLDLLFLAWFVGGFGYLVATMNGPRDPDAGWDDGAVL